jgi:hypothetical protein
VAPPPPCLSPTATLAEALAAMAAARTSVVLAVDAAGRLLLDATPIWSDRRPVEARLHHLAQRPGSRQELAAGEGGEALAGSAHQPPPWCSCGSGIGFRDTDPHDSAPS